MCISVIPYQILPSPVLSPCNSTSTVKVLVPHTPTSTNIITFIQIHFLPSCNSSLALLPQKPKVSAKKRSNYHPLIPLPMNSINQSIDQDLQNLPPLGTPQNPPTTATVISSATTKLCKKIVSWICLSAGSCTQISRSKIFLKKLRC